MNITFCYTTQGFELAHAGLVVMRNVIFPPPFQQPSVTFQMPSFQIYPTATISYFFSACTLKYSACRTMFVCHHKHTHTHSMISVTTLKVSAEKNWVRETSIKKNNISKCYKNVLHWLKDHTVGVKIIISS